MMMMGVSDSDDDDVKMFITSQRLTCGMCSKIIQPPGNDDDDGGE